MVSAAGRNAYFVLTREQRVRARLACRSTAASLRRGLTASFPAGAFPPGSPSSPPRATARHGSTSAHLIAAALLRLK